MFKFIIYDAYLTEKKKVNLVMNKIKILQQNIISFY